MAQEIGFVGKKKKFFAGSVNFTHLFNLCLLPDILEVLTDIDEMSRRRPEILAFFAVSIDVSNCHWKGEILFTSLLHSQLKQYPSSAFWVVVAAP